jgi:succinate-semialdehyde dehydrogenase/glutarate-semialdehyde dehydrogenase
MATGSSTELLRALNIESGLWVAGKYCTSEGSDALEVRDPATEEVIAIVPSATVKDSLVAIDAAAQAFPRWRSVAPRERGEVLRRAFELMIARKDLLAELIVRENGKSLSDALAEVAYAAEFLRWFSEEAVRIGGIFRTAPMGEKKILTMHQPIGVSLLVTPWNFPAAMITRKLGPALAAGCTAVIKPAEETPLTALALAGILHEAGAIPGSVNVIATKDPGEVVHACLQDARVRKLSFTGSTAVGKLLYRQAADRVVNVSMELGGNAPFIVFSDANLQVALEAAMVAKMRNGGQACTAANRFYVQEPIAQQFVAALSEQMASLKVGPGLDPTSEVGPLISEQQRQRVESWLEDALERGSRIATGGSRLPRPGYFLKPTVVSGLEPNSELVRNEVFAPVAPVVSFTDEEEVIAMANDTEYGLSSYVMTADLARAMRVSEQLEVGMVGINRGLLSDPAAPFGGVKQSGIGREGSVEGIMEYLEEKYLAFDW